MNRVPAHRLATILLLLVLPGSADPQNTAAGSGGELVATLAAGQAVIVSARHGVAVATVRREVEPASLPPLIVPLGGGAAAVLFGAVDWQSWPSRRAVLRLEQELPRLGAALAGQAPRLVPEQTVERAGAERLALALLEPLRAAAAGLHAPLDLPDGWPLLELLLVTRRDGTTTVWDLAYPVRQRNLRGDFWDTEVQRARIELRYPAPDSRPVLQIGYPQEEENFLARLLALPNLSGRLADVRQRLVTGKTGRLTLADAAEVLTLALHPSAASGAALLAEIRDEGGFQWVYAPPPESAERQAPASPSGPSLKRPD
jgi:hypothetical protein